MIIINYPILLKESKISFFNQKMVIFLVSALIITLLIDTSIIKVYDLIDKYFISTEEKILLFSINSSVSLFLQFMIINYVRKYFEKKFIRINIKVFSIFSILGISLSAILIGSIILQILILSTLQ